MKPVSKVKHPPTFSQTFSQGHKRTGETSVDPTNDTLGVNDDVSPKAKRPKVVIPQFELLNAPKRKLEEPRPDESGVLPEEEMCKAPLTKVPKQSELIADKDSVKQFAKIPGPHTKRPPEKGVWGTSRTSPEIKLSPKPPQSPRPPQAGPGEAVKGVSAMVIPKEIIDSVVTELSQAQKRQGNKSHSYMELGNQFYAEQGAEADRTGSKVKC